MASLAGTHIKAPEPYWYPWYLHTEIEAVDAHLAAGKAQQEHPDYRPVNITIISPQFVPYKVARRLRRFVRQQRESKKPNYIGVSFLWCGKAEELNEDGIKVLKIIGLEIAAPKATEKPFSWIGERHSEVDSPLQISKRLWNFGAWRWIRC